MILFVRAIHEFFDGGKAFLTDMMLDLAGVVSGDLLVNAKTDEKLGEKGVPLIHFLRQIKTRIGQGDISVAVNLDVTGIF